MEKGRPLQLQLFTNEELQTISVPELAAQTFQGELVDDLSSWELQKATLGMLRHDLTKKLALSEDGYPIVKAYNGDYPVDLVDVNKINRYKQSDKWLNGFSEDIVLERIWKRPAFYLNKVPQRGGFIAPDFSCKLHMNKKEKEFNIYRRNVMAAIAQSFDIPTILPLTWGEYETLDYCFSGIEPEGIYAISNISIQNDPISRKLFRVGLSEAVHVLNPMGFILYGYPLENKYGVETRLYQNQNLQRLWKLRR